MGRDEGREDGKKSRRKWEAQAGWMLIITQLQNMLPCRPENVRGINNPGNASGMDKRRCHSRNVLLGNPHRRDVTINTHTSCMQQTGTLHIKEVERSLVTFFPGLRPT